MLFQPAIIALLMAAGVAVLMLLAAAPFAVQVIRHWDIHSGSEYQLLLERRTYLFSTLATLMLLGITVMLLATFVIVLLWDSHRLLAIGAITVASALATLVSAKRWHERLVNRPAFMAATVAELQRDADLLRPQSANE